VRTEVMFFGGASATAGAPSLLRWAPDSPTVSLIMPYYNYSSYLGDALSSLSSLYDEEKTATEIVFIDNGSSPEEYESLCRMVDEFESRSSFRAVSIYRLDAGLPLGLARNFGVSKVDGDYVCWLDPDDKVLPGRIGITASALSWGAASAIVHANGWVQDPLGRMHPFDSQGPATYERLQPGCCVLCQSTMMPTWMYHALGGQRDLSSAEDYDFWLLAAAYDIRFIHIPFFSYIARQHDLQKTKADMHKAEEWARNHKAAKARAANIWEGRQALIDVRGAAVSIPRNIPAGRVSFFGEPAPVVIQYENPLPQHYTLSIPRDIMTAWRLLRGAPTTQKGVSFDGPDGSVGVWFKYDRDRN